VGYVFRPEDARRYHEWFLREPGRTAFLIEKEVLSRLWSPPSPQRVLEVGCGTGLFLEWFSEQGHQVTGIEPSSPMLNICRERLPERISLDRGYAEHLPYEDNAFDTVALITTLEFVDDPLQALREASRVARQTVLVGALNRYSLISGCRYVERLWKPTVYRHARFFSVFALHQLAHKAFCGSVPMHWRTCLTLPLSTLKYFRMVERSRFFQWHPFGHFIAMRIDPRHTMRTVQQPVFSELPASIGHASIQASCWLLPKREKLNHGPGEEIRPTHPFRNGEGKLAQPR